MQKRQIILFYWCLYLFLCVRICLDLQCGVFVLGSLAVVCYVFHTQKWLLLLRKEVFHSQKRVWLGSWAFWLQISNLWFLLDLEACA